MELAFVLLFVLLGTGAILYAGMRQPDRKPEPAGGVSEVDPATPADNSGTAPDGS